MVHRIFFTLVAIPTTHPLLTEMFFDICNMEITVDIRLNLDICFSHILLWVMFVTKRDNDRIRPIRWKDGNRLDPLL